MSKTALTSLPGVRDLRMLERLRLNPRKPSTGRQRGERLSKAKGVSLEFKDYRDYSEGDDLRNIDWNVLARLGTPIVKTYQDEEDLPIYLLVDGSASMAFGDPEKFPYACKMAAALGAVGLLGGDSAHGVLLGETVVRTRPIRGRRGLTSLTSWLDAQEATGRRGLADQIRFIAPSLGRAGLVILLSDGMDPAFDRMVGLLSSLGHEVWVVQVLSRFEVDPPIEGDLRVIDAETRASVEITANSPTLLQYKRNLEDHNQKVELACNRNGGRYTLVTTEISLTDAFANVFKKQGWVK